MCFPVHLGQRLTCQCVFKVALSKYTVTCTVLEMGPTRHDCRMNRDHSMLERSVTRVMRMDDTDDTDFAASKPASQYDVIIYK